MIREAISKVTSWYFTRKALPYWGIIILDCCIILASHLLVYALNNGTLNTLQQFWTLLGTFSFYLLFYFVGFRIFHTYSGIIRYSSFVDLQRVAFAMLVGLAMSTIFQYTLPIGGFLLDLRMRDIGLSALLSLMLMWAVRVLVKYMYDETFYQAQAKRVFIYGTKEGGVGLAKSIRNRDEAPYRLAGFVSNLEDIRSNYLMGVRVYPNDENLVHEMKKKHVKILFVSPLMNEAIRENADMVGRLISNNIKIYMIPSAQEWDGKSDLNHSRLKEVDIEDLLPRETIDIDMKAVGKLLTNKKILITGAAGSIGSEIVRQVAKFNPSNLVLVDQAETPMHDIRLMMSQTYPDVVSATIVTSITNKTHMESIFATYHPDYVFHAAAYKHVPMMEDNPAQAVQNNVYGTRVIADLAVKYETKKFVMISTDKAVNPTNVMGCSKRICEIYVQSLDRAIKEGKIIGVTQFVTTRFGNVLGSNGSVIPLFRKQLQSGGPLTVTHPDIIRFFMLIPEACKLVLEAGTMGHGGEIFVFDMGEPVRIADLAKRMIKLSGVKDVELKYTGLRDGEKLYEEVLNDAEQTKPTHHPKIKIAAVREYNFEDALANENRLYKVSFGYNDMEIVRVMKEIVPEFKSKHSKYEALD